VSLFRIYRAGFAPALLAVIVLLFALTAPPGPLPKVAAPAEFDEAAAARTARQIVAAAPDRAPGSDGDAAIADMVERRFADLSEGEVAKQEFEAKFEGEDVRLRNVILTFPGDTGKTVALLAPRDSASGPGAASSAAATATLLELVDELRTQSHSKTLVFVSTDGSSAGAAGARQFARHFPGRGELDAVIHLWQPGSAAPRGPYVLDSSTGAQSASVQLVRTAEEALADQSAHAQGDEGTLDELAGLALPAGLSEQAVVIEDGLNAVGLSSAGERPLAAGEDQPDDLSRSTLGDFGRAALVLATTVDGAPEPLAHGPGTYVPLAGNLVPGWTLAILALALLLPAALAAAGGIRHAHLQRHQPVSGASGPSPTHLQRHQPVSGASAPSPTHPLHHGTGWAIGWAASRSLPLIAALVLFYFLGLVGLVARPAFPFDPNQFGVGVGQVIVMVLLVGTIAGGCYAIRVWRVPGALSRPAAVPALGVVSALAVFVAWLANPYLGLLLVPTAHVWLTCAPRRGPLPWPLVALAAILSLVPIAAALDHVSGSLEVGSPAPWLLLLLVSDGQLGFGTMLALCLALGGLLGVIALSLRGRIPARRPGAPRAAAPESSPSTIGVHKHRTTARPPPADWTDLRSSPRAKMTI
jgi:hypothetical protein